MIGWGLGATRVAWGALVVATVAAYSPSAGADQVADCYRLAGHPDDPQAVASGVPFEQIDAPRAVAACEFAVKKHPSDLRIRFHYGRALIAARRGSEAVPHIRMAGDGGYAAAQGMLGGLYFGGTFVRQNLSAAFAWTKLAAEQDVAQAQAFLGLLYLNGQGTQADAAQAAVWFERAVERGNAEAMNALGSQKLAGVGVPKDEAAALDLFRRAAVKGNSDAFLNLGKVHQHGLGVPADLDKARGYYRQASDLGNAEARAALAALDGGTSDTTVAATQPQTPQGPDSETVAQIQSALAELGFDPGPVDGKAGRRTREAVLAFERAEGRRETGSLSAKLLDDLYAALEARNAAAAAQAAAARQETEFRSPEVVKAIQSALTRLGYHPGPSNGEIGLRTREAVRKFRLDYKLGNTSEIDLDFYYALTEQFARVEEQAALRAAAEEAAESAATDSETEPPLDSTPRTGDVATGAPPVPSAFPGSLEGGGALGAGPDDTAEAERAPGAFPGAMGVQ